MQTSTHTSALFSGRLLDIRLAVATGVYPKPIANAIISTLRNATEAYLRGEPACTFTYSAGRLDLRTVDWMESLRGHLEDIFGAGNVSVHRDDSYYLGILISVAL